MKVLFDDASKLSNRKTQYFWEQKLKTKQLLQSGDFSLSTFYFLSFMCKSVKEKLLCLFTSSLLI
jgi:hypothetical protein